MSDTADGAAPSATHASASANGAAVGRPFLSVQFACCSVYQRIYRSIDGTSYRGRCPRCGRPVNFQVGAGGTTARCFRVE